MAKRLISVIEDARSANLKVDRKNGIIRGVKILGLVSENGRRYTPNAVRDAIGMYEGIRVNIDHPEKPDDIRSAEARFGKLINVHFVEGEGLYGDLEFLRSHPMAERICEAAERMPDAFGLSHNAQGEGDENKDGIFVVSKIVEVRHVDVVADPATTKSLSEARKMPYKMREEEEEIKRTMEADNAEFGAKAAEILNGEGDTAAKVQELVKLVHDMYGEKEMDYQDETEAEDPSEEVEKQDEMKEENTERLLKNEPEAIDGEKDGIHIDVDSHKGEEEEDAEDTEETDGMYMTKAKEEEEKKKKPMESKRSFIRRAARACSVELSESAIKDLSLLPKDAAIRQIRRIALAQKASRPRSAGFVPANLAESKLPTGEKLFRWLQS